MCTHFLKTLTALTICMCTSSVLAISPPAPPGCPVSTHHFESIEAVPIPSGPAVVTSQLTVSGLDGLLWDVDVQLFVSHDFPLDLDIALVTPSGFVFTLVSDRGFLDTEVFNGVIFDDQADPGGDMIPGPFNPNLASDYDYATPGTPPRLVPEEPLEGILLFELGNGPWTLVVSDDLAGNAGMIHGFALDFTTIPDLGPSGDSLPPQFVNTTPRVISAVGPNVVQSTIAVGSFGGVVGEHLCTMAMILDLNHSRADDLDITLTSPSGTVCTITTDNGGPAADVFAGTNFIDFANLADGIPPYDFNDGLITDHQFVNLVTPVNLTPEESFGVFRGENPIGVWTLTVSDDANLNGGTLNGWALNLATCIQPDTDADGEPDACDNCIDDPNADQSDTDGDGIGDACDMCFGDNATGDSDADGVCNDEDVCANADDALDADNDSVPDVCDNAPDDANTDQADADSDGIGDVIDACDGDDASGDTDSDGICDDADQCDGDDASGDTDGDGICDDIDACNGDNASGDDDNDGICNDLDQPAAQIADMGACCGGGLPAMMPFLLLGWKRRRMRSRTRIHG